MCLLIALSRTHEDVPLVMAANRDERLDRPAVAMTVLREAAPRIVGGRDELAGGTWLAVNEHGVVAALTNRPMTGGRDLTKRSRGELPMLLGAHRTAAAAVSAFAADVRADDYNPAWMLVGDRSTLFAIDLTGAGPPGVKALGPGVHVLENLPFGRPSPKVDRVLSLLGDGADVASSTLTPRLRAVLSDHGPPALCIHGEEYGTRWSAVVTVPAAPLTTPVLTHADGPPCQAAWVEDSPL